MSDIKWVDKKQTLILVLLKLKTTLSLEYLNKIS